MGQAILHYISSGGGGFVFGVSIDLACSCNNYLLAFKVIVKVIKLVKTL